MGRLLCAVVIAIFGALGSPGSPHRGWAEPRQHQGGSGTSKPAERRRPPASHAGGCVHIPDRAGHILRSDPARPAPRHAGRREDGTPRRSRARFHAEASRARGMSPNRTSGRGTSPVLRRSSWERLSFDTPFDSGPGAACRRQKDGEAPQPRVRESKEES